MDIGRCMNEALDVYKRNLAQLVVAAFLYQLLSILSLSILTGPLAGGWSLMTINALRRKDKYVDLSDLFRPLANPWRLMGLFYVTLIPIILASLMCLVPGLLLLTIWLFAYFLVVDRDEPVFSSLSVSQALVTRSGLGNYILLVIVVLALCMASSAIPYLGVVIGWFLMPIALLMEASAYLQEVDEKKAFDRDPSM